MRIFWFLCGNENTPSSRIHGINVHEKLNTLGYSSNLAHKPHRYLHDLYFHNWALLFLSYCFNKSDTVIFQKVYGKRTQLLMRRLKSKGARLVFIDCDLPIKQEAASLADVIICTSNELSKRYHAAGLTNTVCIEDAVEMYSPPSFHFNSKRRVAWFGKSGLGKWDSLAWFRNEVLPHVEKEWEFITISDHRDATHKWEVNRAPALINQADLVIIPVPTTEADQVKSANRCTQSLALGVPVLCNYLPGYRQVICDYENGLVSNDTNEWIAFMQKLEDDVYLKRMKANAFASAQAFSMDAIIEQWIAALQLKKNKKSFSFWLNLVFGSYSTYYMFRIKLYHWRKSITVF